mmetsp:Transcript_7697/g.24211  ORF Transcript_7697/g.24211 Transcript_7697/m.24211 type:complete len:246 (+) Transcript_7697:575-1312(+)
MTTNSVSPPYRTTSSGAPPRRAAPRAHASTYSMHLTSASPGTVAPETTTVSKSWPVCAPRRARRSAQAPSASASFSANSVPGETSKTSKGLPPLASWPRPADDGFGVGTTPSARVPSLALRRRWRTATALASGSGPSRKKPTDRRARHAACAEPWRGAEKTLSTRPTTRLTASRELLQRRAADWATLVAATTTWSAARIAPRASLMLSEKVSLSQAWNFESPMAARAGAGRTAPRVRPARERCEP